MIGGIPPHEKVFLPRFPGGGFEFVSGGRERRGKVENERRVKRKIVANALVQAVVRLGLLWPSWARLREGGTRVV